MAAGGAVGLTSAVPDGPGAGHQPGSRGPCILLVRHTWRLVMRKRRQYEHTLGELGDLVRRDLAEPFFGSLYTGVEPLGELVRRLAEVETGKARL